MFRYGPKNQFYSVLQLNPDTLYMNIDDTQAELLLTNKVNTTDGGDKSVLTVLKS